MDRTIKTALLGVFDRNFVGNSRVTISRTIPLTVELPFCRLSVFPDDSGYDLGEIETSIDTVLVHTVYPEESRTAREEIDCPK